MAYINGKKVFSAVVIHGQPQEVKLQNKKVTPTTVKQEVTCDPEYTGLSVVTVEAVEAVDVIATEEKTVALSLEYGNQEVYPSTGYALSKVEIVKPDGLKAENIRSGINIAGVIGTYIGSGGGEGSPTLFPPSLAFVGDERFVIVDTENGAFSESYELYADDILIATVTDKNVTLTDYVSDSEAVEVKARALSSKFITSNYSNSLVFFNNATAGLAYSISNDGTYYTCTGMGTATAKDIVIASQIDGVPVKEIGFSSFSNGEITSVKIPKGVEKILTIAFSNCGELVTVQLSNGLKIIDAGAFQNCINLKRIDIPETVTQIFGSAFNNTALTSVYLPTTPPTLQNTTAFSDIASGCVFYCKNSASLASYRSATNWSSLASTYTFKVG